MRRGGNVLSLKSAVPSLSCMRRSCSRCRTQRLKLCHSACSKLGLHNEQTYPCAARERKRCHQQTRKGHVSVTRLAPVSDVVKRSSIGATNTEIQTYSMLHLMCKEIEAPWQD